MLLRIISSTIGLISVAMGIYALIRVHIHKKFVQKTVENMDKVIAEIEEDKAKMVDLHRAHTELEELINELTSTGDINPCILEDIDNFKSKKPLKFHKSNDELLDAVIDYCFTEIKDDSALDKYIKENKKEEDK
ncbi:hypothetical protein JDFnp4_33 [Fusobacterium phage JD-Fnp4]|nr:hypothetical protein JDFnp4_33 [Fusobacterium phage JD-Fnp4]